MGDYRLIRGTAAHALHNSRAKVQLMGGGFANGKTAALVVKGLRIAKDYPGSNGLLGRETYPKLLDTVVREFEKWCPPHWIASFPKTGANALTCKLKNGSTINFRYVQQQGKKHDEQTSNLLSATYDWVGIDQIEDPLISYKDFLDLLGRLRGNAVYRGDDRTMPLTGPRWLLATCNPTRGWVYKKIVKPYQDWMDGRYNPELLCVVDEERNPILKDGKPQPIIEIFNGSTYENASNLGADYIQTLESAYAGSMAERFLHGMWKAYEGLVYPGFDDAVHVRPHTEMLAYLDHLLANGVHPFILEGYDHGIASPACYLIAFVDLNSNIHVFDGFYEPEKRIEELAVMIKAIRRSHLMDTFDQRPQPMIHADPQIFKRTGESRGPIVADQFRDEDIVMVRGANSILAGVNKINTYLTIRNGHRNPYTNATASPHLFVSDKLSFFMNEIVDYYWKRNNLGTLEDAPIDRNDHAMDTLKYLMTMRKMLATAKVMPTGLPAYMTWQEIESIQLKARHQ